MHASILYFCCYLCSQRRTIIFVMCVFFFNPPLSLFVRQLCALIASCIATLATSYSLGATPPHQPGQMTHFTQRAPLVCQASAVPTGSGGRGTESKGAEECLVIFINLPAGPHEQEWMTEACNIVAVADSRSSVKYLEILRGGNSDIKRLHFYFAVSFVESPTPSSQARLCSTEAHEPKH